MKLNSPEVKKMFDKLGDLDVITFDPKKIQKRIIKAYDLRYKAHGMLLEADCLLDTILKELTKSTKSNGEIKISKGGATNKKSSRANR